MDGPQRYPMREKGQLIQIFLLPIVEKVCDLDDGEGKHDLTFRPLGCL